MAPVKTNIEQALETMKASGLKYTKKRELLMSYLIKRNRYVSAREVYEFMNETFKGVSYDTVYRNLHDFERLELLEKTELNGEQKVSLPLLPRGGTSSSLYLYGLWQNGRNSHVSDEFF